MDESSPVREVDVRLLREVLELADPLQPDPTPGVTLRMLEQLVALFDCDRATLRALCADGSTAVFTAGREDDSTYPVSADRPGTQRLGDRWAVEDGAPVEDRVSLGWPAGGRHEIVVELVRVRGTAFGPRELLLLELLEPQLTSWLLGTTRRDPPHERLTPRQAEILRLAQLGLSNREISRGLGISEATVRKHLENAYARLGVPSRTAAVLAAFGPVPDYPEGGPTRV